MNAIIKNVASELINDIFGERILCNYVYLRLRSYGQKKETASLIHERHFKCNFFEAWPGGYTKICLARNVLNKIYSLFRLLQPTTQCTNQFSSRYFNNVYEAKTNKILIIILLL